jgi:hypothetical protein
LGERRRAGSVLIGLIVRNPQRQDVVRVSARGEQCRNGCLIG